MLNVKKQHFFLLFADKEKYDQVRTINELSARKTMKYSANGKGISAGAPGGLTVFAAIEIGEEQERLYQITE